MSDLKPGDRALIVGSKRRNGPRYNGTVCTVDSPAYPWPIEGSDFGLLVHDITTHDGEHHDAVASVLVRLPPDDEAKRLFRETEKPVAA